MVAIALIATRRSGCPARYRSVALGVLLGLINLAIAWFVNWWLTGPFKPILIIDILLISGMIGGIHAASITGLISLLARFYFGDSAGMAPVVAEAAMFFMAGIALHRLVGSRISERLSWQLIACVCLTRISITYVAIGASYLAGLPADFSLADFALLRSLVLPLSLVLLASTLLLVHADAQIDRSHQIEARLSRTDTLTGLPNRRALTEYLRPRSAGAMPVSGPSVSGPSVSGPSRTRGISGLPGATIPGAAEEACCLLVIQLSHLKEVLSRYGLHSGSLLWLTLKESGMASRLLEPLARYRPTLFQFSDFALATPLEGTTIDRLEASGDVERFLGGLHREMQAPWPGLSFRCAVVDTRMALDNDDLPYRNITLALNSLESGVAYFNDLMQRSSALDDEIDVALRRWMSEGDVPLGYQPKIRLSDGAIIGAEALLRMRDQHGRPVAAMRAISLFRRRRCLPAFEWAVITSVVRFLSGAGRECLRSGWVIALNITPESLQVPAFGERVVRLLSAAGVPGSCIRLELIEWSALEHLPEVHRNIDRLQRAGVTLALDDFGVGFSSLLLLVQLPIREVKIDQAMIAALESGRSRTVINIIVAAAQRDGAIVVAEGVETRETEEALRLLKVDHAQGHLYADALNENELLAFVDAWQPGLRASATRRATLESSLRT